MPVTLNQDNVILDGQHRMRACTELGIPAIYAVRDFTGKPIQELEFVVSVNLHRRHLDEFQKAEIGIKMRSMAQRITNQRFTSETGHEAVSKRYKQMPPEPEPEDQEEEPQEEEDFEQEGEPQEEVSQVLLPKSSRDQSGSNESNTTTTTADSPAQWAATNETLANYVGVSAATMARVETILEEGTPEQIATMRDKEKKGKSPGVRTMYEEVQNEKVKNKLKKLGKGGGGSKQKQVRRENMKLIEKDFRLITQKDIPDESVDLVLVLDFPEPRPGQKEDEWGRIHEQLMHSSANWLRDGGLLVMHVPQPFIPRCICDRPPMLQYYHIIAMADAAGVFPAQDKTRMFHSTWRPYVVYVPGVRDVQPGLPDDCGSDVIANSSEGTDDVEFVSRIVTKLSQNDTIIVDPFMGQTKGTLGEAVLRLGGRKYVGIERDSTLFLTAMDRLEKL